MSLPEFRRQKTNMEVVRLKNNIIGSMNIIFVLYYINEYKQ